MKNAGGGTPNLKAVAKVEEWVPTAEGSFKENN